MIKVPAAQRRTILEGLKNYKALINNLAAKGKSSSEEDARILLNDILAEVLGYDKYNELKTELREKNGRCDYIVKLNDGPNSKKPEKFDFVIEAKAIHVELSQAHIDQTLSFCVSKGLDFFVLTNASKWQLFKVKRTKNGSDSSMIHEINFALGNKPEEFVDDFYIFSKHCYLTGSWDTIASVAKATNMSDVATVIISTKVLRTISRILEEEHDTKVKPEAVKEIIEEKLFSSKNIEINKSLLKRLNKPQSPKKVSNITDSSSISAEEETAPSDDLTTDESEQEEVA